MKHFIILLILLPLIACKKPQPRHNYITKIEIATTGELPTMSIMIDSNLNYNYYGGAFAVTKGYYTGRITKAYWDTINMKFENAKYKQADTVEHTVIYDTQQAEVIIYYGNKRKHIRRYNRLEADPSKPVDYTRLNLHKPTAYDPISRVINSITDSMLMFYKPKSYKGRIKFETTYQNTPLSAKPPIANK